MKKSGKKGDNDVLLYATVCDLHSLITVITFQFKLFFTHLQLKIDESVEIIFNICYDLV